MYTINSWMKYRHIIENLKYIQRIMSVVQGFSLSTFFGDIRSFIFGGIQVFPMAIGGALLILGLMTANYAVLFFLIAYLIIVPGMAYGLNLIVDSLTVHFEFMHNWFKVRQSDICGLVIPFRDTISVASPSELSTVFNTPWLSMTVFFLGYMMSNAIALHKIDSAKLPKGAPEELKTSTVEKIAKRKVQSTISIGLIILVAILLIGSRLKYSGCETIGGVIWTSIIYGWFGFGWYSMLAKIGQERLSDLFGIANRLLSPYAVSNEPVACFPVVGKN